MNSLEVKIEELQLALILANHDYNKLREALDLPCLCNDDRWLSKSRETLGNV